MTNLQQLVLDYLGGNRRDPRVGSCVFSSLNELADSISKFEVSRKDVDWNHVQEIRENIADYSLVRLKKLEKVLEEAPVTFEAAHENIEKLKQSDPRNVTILMTAHQPNLFAYTGVLKKIALISKLSHKLSSSDLRRTTFCFFGIADHDFANNRWVRSAEIPCHVRKEGVLRSNVKLSKRELGLPSNSIPKPTRETLDAWKSQIESWITETSNLAKKELLAIGFRRNAQAESAASFEAFWGTVERVLEQATSLADFSSLILQAESAKMFSQPIAFADFSNCFSLFRDEYKEILQNLPKFSRTIAESEEVLRSTGVDSGLSDDSGFDFPVWMKCDCGGKFKLISSESTVVGKCSACQKEMAISWADLLALLDSRPELFEPRSVSMPIVFSKGFAMSCYVGGIGGLGYLLHSRSVSEKFGIPFPPTPVWYVRDIYTSLEQLAILSQLDRLGKQYGVELDDRDNLSEMKSRGSRILSTIESGLADGRLQKNPVLERDRQLLQRIGSFDNGYPNMIGLSVNFRMEDVGTQWEQFLERNGSLQVPVLLKSRWDEKSV